MAGVVVVVLRRVGIVLSVGVNEAVVSGILGALLDVYGVGNRFHSGNHFLLHVGKECLGILALSEFSPSEVQVGKFLCEPCDAAVGAVEVGYGVEGIDAVGLVVECHILRGGDVLVGCGAFEQGFPVVVVRLSGEHGHAHLLAVLAHSEVYGHLVLGIVHSHEVDVELKVGSVGQEEAETGLVAAEVEVGIHPLVVGAVLIFYEERSLGEEDFAILHLAASAFVGGGNQTCLHTEFGHLVAGDGVDAKGTVAVEVKAGVVSGEVDAERVLGVEVNVRLGVDFLLRGVGIVQVGSLHAVHAGIGFVFQHFHVPFQAFHVEDARHEVVAPAAFSHRHPFALGQFGLGRGLGGSAAVEILCTLHLALCQRLGDGNLAEECRCHGHQFLQCKHFSI